MQLPHEGERQCRICTCLARNNWKKRKKTKKDTSACGVQRFKPWRRDLQSSSYRCCWWWCRDSCPRMSVDILGTNCDQCLSMVQCCFTSTETGRLIRTESPGRPPRLSHSSWTQTHTGEEAFKKQKQKSFFYLLSFLRLLRTPPLPQ